ncbi:MAG TPA: potassium-transporting ATPase subunit F [Candidatus Competibacteraceae bacterium]|nr:potassium-transporting ATPase subunit F [Candidatus Competibacteraceae bacterium]
MNPIYLSSGLVALVLFIYQVSISTHPLYLIGGLIALVLVLYLLIALFKAEAL